MYRRPQKLNSYAEAYTNLGIVLKEQGEWADAQTSYEKQSRS